MTSRLSAILALLTVCIAIGGCTAIPKEDKILLKAETDCTNAKAQIAALKRIKPEPQERVVAAVQSVTPGGIVSGLLTDQYADRAKVALGEHGQEIDAKIQAIRRTCGIPTPPEELKENSLEPVVPSEWP